MNRFGNRKAALEFSKWGMAQEVNDWHSVTGTLDQLGGLPAGLSSADAGDMLFNVLAMVAEFSVISTRRVADSSDFGPVRA